VPRIASLWLLLFPCILAAQAPASLQRAVQSITAEDIRRRIAILADDSTRGRDTPSPELEKVASWIAAEFRRFGLKPGGSDGTYLQRYAILRKQIDTTQTLITVSRAGASAVTLRAGRDLNVLQPGSPQPSRDLTGAVILLPSGPDPGSDPLAGVDVRGAWVAALTNGGGRGLRIDVRAVQIALAAGAMGLIVISNRSDAEWQARMRGSNRPTVALGPEPGADTTLVPGLVEIRDEAAARALGIDPAALRAMKRRSAQRLDGITVRLHVREHVLSAATAPNVIGILEGSDSKLKNEYVFFTAHMDHLGVASPLNPACRARGADSICNGADDDASGTAAVIENAEAFSQLDPRPARSLVFMTVSGEEKGLWGSEYFTAHPTVPLSAVVADLNTDMVGRNWKDTIAAIGKEQSDLGATLDRVAAEHPELQLTPIGDIWPNESFYTRSDHYNFARRGVPILFFFNGTHGDYHRASDDVSKIDAEKESRIVRLVFYLGLAVASATERPRWDPASYKRVVEGGK
jgi:peptidase M28-like protein